VRQIAALQVLCMDVVTGRRRSDRVRQMEAITRRRRLDRGLPASGEALRRRHGERTHVQGREGGEQRALRRPGAANREDQRQ